ncbi:MAG: hypothetical protein K6G09_01555 [Treponema sp.]|nr:hypothetical protein [Treponema sp.]
MEPWLVVVLITLASIVFGTGLVLLIQFIYVKALENRSIRSIGWVKHAFRFIVYVIGKIRAGKTTFMAGCLAAFTEKYMHDAHTKIDFCCLAFPTVNFSLADDTIENDFGRGLIDSEVTAAKLMRDVFSNCNNLYYDNQLNPKPIAFRRILVDYIDASWALMRNNYVAYAGRAYHSPITDNDAMPYDPRMWDIRDIAEQQHYVQEANKNLHALLEKLKNMDEKSKEKKALKATVEKLQRYKDTDEQSDWHLFYYCAYAQDEKQLDARTDAVRSMAENLEDHGNTVSKRLIGQLTKEHAILFCTAQQFGADNNRERALATEIPMIEKSEVVDPYFLPRFLIACYEFYWKHQRKRLQRRAEKAALKTGIDPNLVFTLKEQSKIRDHLSKSMIWKKYWHAKSFVHYTGKLYYSPDDVGKSRNSLVSGYNDIDVLFPIKWAFGSTDTFLFNAVNVKMNATSRYRLRDEDFREPATHNSTDSLTDEVLMRNSDRLKAEKK